MRPQARHLFLLVSLAAAIAMGWGLLETRLPVEQAVPELPTLREAEQSTATGVNLVQYDGQRRQWALQAERAHNREDGFTVAIQPRLDIFMDAGGVIRVQAAQGLVNDATREIAFSGSVVVEDDQNRRLTTEALRFDPERRMLFGDQEFQMQGGRLTLTGEGLEIDQDNRVMRIKRRVRVVIENGFLDLV